jgi:hypothetical protein
MGNISPLTWLSSHRLKFSELIELDELIIFISKYWGFAISCESKMLIFRKTSNYNFSRSYCTRMFSILFRSTEKCKYIF